MKNRITGRSAFLALLKDEGITHLFGNPGTTELPIMHALKDHPDLTYVMAMQESLVVAIADGFSRASGRLVACNVHVAPGLGNAMGSLFNAKFTGTPMILTAGQQEQGHGLTEPVLYGPLVQMAEPLVKWAVEVTRLEDLPRIVRRAAKIATTPPTGPVFISLPGDILNSEAGIDLGRSTRVDTRVRPSDESLKALTDRILRAQRPVIVAGDEIVKSDALKEAAALAETLGIRFNASGATEPDTSLKRATEDHPWSLCRRPWTLMYFTAHGRAIPCCIAPFSMRGYDGFTLGDATQQSLREIWNGPRYRQFRRALLSAAPPPACASCGVRWSL